MAQHAPENLLAHLFSTNEVYRERIIDLYFHPSLATCTDPLVTVHSRSAMKSLLALECHSWIVSDFNVQVKSFSESEDTLVVETGG